MKKSDDLHNRPDYSDPSDQLTPLKAIRAFCLKCVGDQREEVLLCTGKTCALYPHRLGKNPKRKGVRNFNAAPPKRKSRASEKSLKLQF